MALMSQAAPLHFPACVRPLAKQHCSHHVYPAVISVTVPLAAAAIPRLGHVKVGLLVTAAAAAQQMSQLALGRHSSSSVMPAGLST